MCVNSLCLERFGLRYASHLTDSPRVSDSCAQSLAELDLRLLLLELLLEAAMRSSFGWRVHVLVLDTLLR